MLPKPMALPAATNTAPILLPNDSLLFISPIKPNLNLALLALQRHTHSGNLASEWRSNLGYLALQSANLRKATTQGLYNVLCYALDGVLCATHLLAHHLVDGKIVHRLGDIVLLGNRSQFGCDSQRHLEVTTRLTLEFVTTMEGSELQAFQLYCIQIDTHLLNNYEVVVLLATLHKDILLGNQILSCNHALDIRNLLLVERYATALNHLAALALRWED